MKNRKNDNKIEKAKNIESKQKVESVAQKRFNLIRDFFMNKGRLPNYEEVAKVCGVKSKNAAYKIVDACIKEGLLKRDKKGRLAFAQPVLSDLDHSLASAASPVPSPILAEMAEDILSELDALGALGVQGSKEAPGAPIPYLSPQMEVRLLGWVEAGFPSMAEEHTHDTIALDEYLIPHRDASYMLKVKGDSMRDAGIMNGDMVIVERKTNARPGDIVIARIDGEFTMKYYRIGRKNGKEVQYLEAANTDYKPMYPKNSLEIQAVVRSVVRTYGY